MDIKPLTSLLAAGLLALSLIGSHSALAATKPVTPNASEEAKALLKYLYKISGKKS
jgi:hypothetical protein